jgi:hypothetical protein
MARAGAVLGGRYVLDRRIGDGGHGEVWQATDNVLRRPVAVKLLHPRYAGRNEALTRFQAEARLAGALSHENIAQVYDYGEQAGGQPPYLATELVDGPSVQAALAGGPLASSLTMDIVAQAAAGLQAAHAAGLTHRDVKPANLLLAPDGTVKITDFGIAHTAGSAPATPASDLYALGMVAYECLVGTPPFRGPPPAVALAPRDCPLPPLPPSVPEGVTALVMRMTAKDPAYRPDDAAEVAVWAGLLRDGLGTGLAPLVIWSPAPPPRPPGAAARLGPRTLMAYGGLAVMAVVIIVLGSIIGFSSAPRPVSASSAAPAPVRHGGPGRRPARAHDRPVTRTVRKPAVSPGAEQEPADRVPVVMMAYPARGHRPGHGDGHGDWYGYDYGQGQGKGDGLGEFNWHNGKTGNFLDPMSNPHDDRPAGPPPGEQTRMAVRDLPETAFPPP